jgi:hypothetical protein
MARPQAKPAAGKKGAAAATAAPPDNAASTTAAAPATPGDKSIRTVGPTFIPAR